MEVLTTTPFGRRPVTAGLIERAQAAQRPAPLPRIDKWELFRLLCEGRAALGVSSRNLTVLNALLSFHPDAALSDNANLIVFPSNAALSQRSHGMAESTLRRNLADLLRAGLILRHDSPNGKRYAARDPQGEISRAFGFDLRPLLVRAEEIASAAQQARAAEDRLRRAREAVSLLRRDAVKLAAYGRETAPRVGWDGVEAALLDVHRRMRRKAEESELMAARQQLESLLITIRNKLNMTEKMDGNDVQNGRHYSNSNTEFPDSEPCRETGKGGDRSAETPPPGQTRGAEPNIPLPLVLKACPDILPYAQRPPRSWHELVGLAALVRGMMGISQSCWDEAQLAMGPEIAAVTVAGILQRVGKINNPGGYLRALTRQADSKGFSPGPMIMALLRPAGQG